jgi:hypothetical protein
MINLNEAYVSYVIFSFPQGAHEHASSQGGLKSTESSGGREEEKGGGQTERVNDCSDILVYERST